LRKGEIHTPPTNAVARKTTKIALDPIVFRRRGVDCCESVIVVKLSEPPALYLSRYSINSKLN
jgi:hypothetical protein